MGGAAAALSQPPLKVDALVLEEVYPDLQDAVADRLTSRLGTLAKFLTPLLTCQLHPRLGFTADALRPIDQVSKLQMPKLFIAGSADDHTRIEESRGLFAAACEPKELWIVSGARHVDLYKYAQAEYAKRVPEFFDLYLR